MTDISRVVITGGHETGGVQSYAATLAEGFMELGIPAEVIPPGQIYRRWHDLRDRKVLKVLSTTAVFAAPFARLAICMAHGFPRADVQGWAKALAIIASLKLASWCSGAKLVAISHYAAVHLKAIYNIKIEGVIHNPLNPIFFEPAEDTQDRTKLTYIGRLHPVKNIDKLVPVMKSVLEEHPELQACIVGDGSLREDLMKRVQHDSRVEFTGGLDARAVRDILRRTKVFISGCETEGLGITYLEALSQGCAVVMPACGGGMEIAPDRIGTQIQLMPLTFEHDAVKDAICRALQYNNLGRLLTKFRPEVVASEYLVLALSYDRPIGSMSNRHSPIDAASAGPTEQSLSYSEANR